MQARAYKADGTPHSKGFELPETTFDGRVNETALHEVVTAIRARGRQGNAATKTRGFVQGGTRKPWRQKGTGRARHGTIRSPIWRGGGVVFGPSPRDYDKKVPKKLRRLAIRSALNARALEDRILVIDSIELDAPRTRSIVELLETLEIEGRHVLLLTDGLDREVYLSSRNIPDVEVRPWGEASAYDILWSDVVIVESSALGAAASPGKRAGRDEEAASASSEAEEES